LGCWALKLGDVSPLIPFHKPLGNLFSFFYGEEGKHRSHLDVLSTERKEMGEIWLYHGTSLGACDQIMLRGFDIDKSLETGDFGKGLYVTDDLDQAHHFARRASIGTSFPQNKSAVIAYRVPTAMLDSLNLTIVTGESWNGLVCSCKARKFPQDRFHGKISTPAGGHIEVSRKQGPTNGILGLLMPLNL